MLVNVKAVWSTFADYVARAEPSEELFMSRKEKSIARLVPPQPFPTLDPDLLAEGGNRLYASKGIEVSSTWAPMITGANTSSTTA